VLVVDAESLVRWALAQTLTARGCVVTDVASAAGALQRLSGPHPEFDVIVLDHCLSETHDLSLLEAARALSPRSRIVMLTACMPPELAAEACRCGARAVLEKPVDLEALAALVTAPSD
jgi:ATP-dependent Lon protease